MRLFISQNLNRISRNEAPYQNKFDSAINSAANEKKKPLPHTRLSLDVPRKPSGAFSDSLFIRRIPVIKTAAPITSTKNIDNI